MGQIGGAVELLRVPVLKSWAGLFSAAALLSRISLARAWETPVRVSLSRFSLGLCSGVLDLRRDSLGFEDSSRLSRLRLFALVCRDGLGTFV